MEAITTQTDDAAPVVWIKTKELHPTTEKEKAVQLPFDFRMPEDKELDENPERNATISSFHR